MSASATAQTTEPWLVLPGGFPPDTISFALRTTAALLIAYYFSFWIQLASASSAGICVAIVAQPQTGGMMSKSMYRIAGTLIGGIAAVIATAVFGQDRSMLLVVFTLWLAACTFAASLLKDFRAYGAALAGYTLAIISITDIDVPQDVFLTALDRVAAILVGVGSMALVNSIFARADAWETLVKQLGQQINKMTEQAIRTLRGELAPLSVADEAEQATTILALRTQATFVIGELQDGRPRAAGARSAIAALTGMLSATRVIDSALAQVRPDPASGVAIDQTIAWLRQSDADMAAAREIESDPHDAADLGQIFLLDRLHDLATQHAYALDGLEALKTGRQPVRRVRMKTYNDTVGALFNAMRTGIVTALAAVFCIYSGWSGATFILVQLSAVVALLGMQPNPTRAAVMFSTQVPVPILMAGLVEFFLLPKTGDFLSFALAVAPFSLVACAIARHPRSGAGASTGMLLWYVLLLAPANPPSYNLSSFFNLALQLAGSMVAVIVGFAVILPTSPPRRLFRVLRASLYDLRCTLRKGRRYERAAMVSLRYDRLQTALLWLGRRTPARLKALYRVRDLGELDAALLHAQVGLDATLQEAPSLAHEVTAARAALRRTTPDAVQDAGVRLLAAARVRGSVPRAARQAASGLYGAAMVLRRQRHFLQLVGFGKPS